MKLQVTATKKRTFPRGRQPSESRTIRLRTCLSPRRDPMNAPSGWMSLIAVIGDVFMLKNGESRCPRCGQKLGDGLAGSYSFENIPTYNGG